MTPPTVSLALGFLVETIGVTPWMIGPPDENPQCQPLPHAQALAVLFCSVACCLRTAAEFVESRIVAARIDRGRAQASFVQAPFFYARKHIPHKVPETFNFCLELCHQFFNRFFLSAGTTTLFFGTLFVRVGRNSFFPFWQIDPRCFESQ